jgi:hypothetical protein
MKKDSYIYNFNQLDVDSIQKKYVKSNWGLGMWHYQEGQRHQK